MDSITEYVSVAPNRVQHCISMKDNILIYGACNAVVMAKFNNSEKSWEVVKSVVGKWIQILINIWHIFKNDVLKIYNINIIHRPHGSSQLH